MADLTTIDGKEITFDMSRLSLREYRALFNRAQPQTEEDATACKVSGLTLDEYLDINLDDNKRFWKALLQKAREPLADPN